MMATACSAVAGSRALRRPPRPDFAQSHQHVAASLTLAAGLRIPCAAPRHSGWIAQLVEQGTHKPRSEEHTSELQSLMRISYAVFCLTKNNPYPPTHSLSANHQ